MKEAFPTLLKFLGALAITTAIFFALSPDDKIDDEVLNRSMEFLGAKLLAMVPEDQKRDVQKDFDDFSEQTRDGEISDEHFAGVAMAILNAEAEGKKFDREQVDGLLAVIQEKQAQKAESEIERKEDLIALSERVQDFEKFEREWKRMIPLPPLPDSTLPPPTPRRAFYRVKPNFVVEVDTAAIAEIALEHVKIFDAETPQAAIVQRIEVDHALKELARELPRLKIEMRQAQFHFQMADSIRKAAAKGRQQKSWQVEWNSQMSDSMRTAIKALRQQQMRQTRVYMHMADSARKAAHAHDWESRRMAPHPIPPLPPEATKSEKQKPPQ